MDIFKYYHTLKYLKPEQILNRLYRSLHHPVPDIRPAPRKRTPTRTWIEGIRKAPAMLGPTRFRFLNEEHELKSLHSWNDAALGKLWLYNLHYFDDLNAVGSLERQEWHKQLILKWICHNQPGVGVGWEPYPLSKRLVNMIVWALCGNALPAELNESLAVHARFLKKSLEYHLLCNHLFENAKALLYAGAYYDGIEAQTWFRKGLCVLEKEVEEQILPDGGHIERSPMYHAIILEDILDVLNLFNVYSGLLPPVKQSFCFHLVRKIKKMLIWLKAMTHPDGNISLFNDAAFCIGADVCSLEGYAKRLGVEDFTYNKRSITELTSSGFIRLENEEAVVIMDVGKIGPDYNPGHAHAGTFSFEMSLFGKRFIVDTGTSCYGQCKEREIQRSTRSHNTVVVNNQDSSEVWGNFRVARRARSFGLKTSATQEYSVVICSHDGYSRLHPDIIHTRRWILAKDKLTIIDVIEGTYASAVGFFHLHPEVSAEVFDGGCRGQCMLGDKRICWELYAANAFLEKSVYHPEFGVSQQNECIRVQFLDKEISIVFSW